MDRLNILVLHCLGSPAFAPNFLEKHVFALQRNFPEHNYLYHDAALPLPRYVSETAFDAIILDVSFLFARWAGQAYFEDRLRAYSFVTDSEAVKIAFPQDEYDCHVLLDDWMCAWKVDVVFSVIASGWEILYPRFHRQGEIRLGYTGYIDECLLDWPRKPFSQRTVDIGYRARKLLPYFGRLGETKWTIGRDVAVAARVAGLSTDIVLGDSGTLFGRDWLNFINNSKFTLGANSGSSLLDPKGNIQRLVKDYVARNPGAEFEEVEAHCFPGQDGLHAFTAISPRVLEAALLDSCQILVDGEYSGIVKPWEHYIPIRHDASNFPEVLSAMRDQDLVLRMIKDCREAVLSVDALRYRHSARQILELIGELKTRKRVTTNSDVVRSTVSRYQQEMAGKYARYWRRQVYRRKIANCLDAYPRVARLVRAIRNGRTKAQ